ncbi:actin depolymerizing factor [Gigaspora margarita]|uniref:Cofilin n=1 Tax=Gigaspora margarita TaxID=4874 RepID=A0A8H4EPR9_GIGMA|nr:actin depolymerizing factor [Gigaspora margarita]
MSSASGVIASDECMDLFQDLKLKKRYKYILFKINDSKGSTEIVVDRAVETATYEEFKTVLATELEEEPRYAVFDFDYEKPGAGQRNKLVFFSWVPDKTSNVKLKMLYASSKDAIRKRLDGIGVEVQGTDAEEIDYATVLEKATRSN